MEIFHAEKLAVVQDQSNKTCRCGKKLALVRVIVNSLTGDIVSLVQMPVRRTHLAGIGYPSRWGPVGIAETIFASARLGEQSNPATSGSIWDPLFMPQIAACVRF